MQTKFNINDLVQDTGGNKSFVVRHINIRNSSTPKYFNEDMTIGEYEDALEKVVPKKMFYIYVSLNDGSVCDYMMDNEGITPKGSRNGIVNRIKIESTGTELPYQEKAYAFKKSRSQEEEEEKEDSDDDY